MAYKKLKYWFDKELAELLAAKISSVNPEFESVKFTGNIDKKINDLELKDRVEVIADEIKHCMGTDYKKNISILLKTLGPENKEETGMFSNYYWIMPFAKYVEKYGLPNFDTSMQAIFEITKRNTGEYTIRPFIEKYPQKTISQMLKWSKHKNKHVRRLASEGGRPRLPWAAKLQLFIDNPKPLFPILNSLKNDSSKYVQKSVANCINDILKDNFEIGKALVEDWAIDPSRERKWIIKHGLRNFIKKENVWALAILQKLNDYGLKVHRFKSE